MAGINEVCIVEEEEDRQKRRPLGYTGVCQKALSVVAWQAEGRGYVDYESADPL